MVRKKTENYFDMRSAFIKNSIKMHRRKVVFFIRSQRLVEPLNSGLNTWLNVKKRSLQEKLNIIRFNETLDGKHKLKRYSKNHNIVISDHEIKLNGLPLRALSRKNLFSTIQAYFRV